MIYTYKLSFVLLLTHFLVNISTANFDKVVSMLFAQSGEYLLPKLSSSTKYQH